MKLYEISYCNHAGVPSIIHVNANDAETARAWFEACECENGELFYGIREGASSSRPGVPVRTVPADWQPIKPEQVEACPYSDGKCGDHAQCSKCSRGEVESAEPEQALSLAALIPLKSKVTVYVPSTINVNEETDSTPYVELVARFLSEAFGGATAAPCAGYWVAADKSLVAERTTMVFAYCSTEQAEKYMDDVVRLCYRLKVEMSQEAIALEYNGGMYFI